MENKKRSEGSDILLLDKKIVAFSAEEKYLIRPTLVAGIYYGVYIDNGFGPKLNDCILKERKEGLFEKLFTKLN